MGYAHYFELQKAEKKIPEKALKIIEPILEEAYKTGLIQQEYDKPEPPICTEKEIAFNGVGENGHETFYFRPNFTDFNFCKTARKPYDIVVMKVLLVLKCFFDIDLGTDGNFEDEWQDVRNYMEEKYNITSYVKQDLDFTIN